MKSKTGIAVIAGLLGSIFALGQAPARQHYPREVTVSGIPGVVAAGSKWQMAWWGLDNADGIVGTPDGGVIFAQREVRRVRKVDASGQTSVLLENTGAAPAVSPSMTRGVLLRHCGISLLWVSFIRNAEF